jgi:hypothetical protein
VRVLIVSVPDWPNRVLADGRVREALARVGLESVEPEHRTVDSAEQALAEGFHGSPSIAIDGLDPFADPTTPVGFGCRLYRTEAGLEGAPSVSQLEAAVRQAL